MNFYKSLSFLSIILILILFVGTVSATETNLTDSLESSNENVVEICNLALDDSSVNGDGVVDDANAVSNQADGKLRVSENVVLRAETGTYAELKELIDSNTDGVISLDKDYAYVSGDPNFITINKPITINGNGHYVSGSNQKLIFYLPAGGSGTVLNNISLINGYYGNGPGALWLAASDCVINNTVFDNNQATYAGAIYVTSAATNNVFENTNFTNNKGSYSGVGYVMGANSELINCSFTDNHGDYYAGGIYFSSGAIDSKITDSTFENNDAGAYGGAVYAAAANLNIDGTNFTNNQAGLGGAIYWSASDGTVSDSNFNGNSAEQYGGAIYWLGSDGIVTGSNFTSNHGGYDGGAIYWGATGGKIENSVFEENYSPENAGAITVTASGNTISGSKFKKNNAQYSGGAIYLNEGNNKIDNCEFDENTAKNDGGAIYSNYGNGNTVDHSTFDNNSATHGGAIYAKSDSFGIKNSEFNNNSAGDYSDGGAVYLKGKSGSIISSKFNDNEASSGGAVCLDGDDGTISKSEFNNNSAFSTGGAVLINGKGCQVSISDFNNNSAGDYGGAVLCYGENGVISKSNFNNNTAEDEGGAVSWWGAEGSIKDSTFKDNTALKGGAVYLASANNMVIEKSKFNDNIASTDGGAVYASNTYNAAIKGSKFRNNSADQRGGAIYLTQGENPIIHDSDFDENKANWDGGAVYSITSNTLINKSDFNNNEATYCGGAVYLLSNGTINKSDFYTNTAENGGAVYLYGSNSLINNSDFGGNTAINGGAINWNGKNGNLNNSEFWNNAADYGGAVYFAKNSVNSSVLNSKLYYNDAYKSGAGIYWDSDDGTVNNTLFDGNSVNSDEKDYGHAGAIDWHGNNALVNNSVFKYNRAYSTHENATCQGGAIRFLGNNTTVKNSTFTSNFARSNGGAIYWTGSDGTLDNSTFNKNYVWSDGGAVYWEGANAILNRSSFDSNRASIGGALLMASTNGIVNNTNFTNNDADPFAGGAISLQAAGYIDNSNFINNTAHKGGAIHMLSSEPGVVNNSYFENNYAVYGAGAISCDYDNFPNKVIANSEFVKNSAHDFGGAISSINAEIINSTFKNNKAHLGGAIHSYSSKIVDSEFVNNKADYGKDLYYFTDPVLENTDVPKANIEIVPGQLIRITGDIGNSTRTTNTTYVAVCIERFTYYPRLGSSDDTLRALINVETGQNIAEYLKILVYTYFNSTDDVYPHDGDNYTLYPEDKRDDENRWDYAVQVPRPDYFSRAVHEFSDHDFWNSPHPVVQKVIELYESGFRVPNHALKYVDGKYIRYNFTSMISSASQSLFLFTMDNLTPNMTVKKITLNQTVYIGNQTMFEIVVNNTGEVNLSDINVTDIGYDHNGLKLVGFNGKNWFADGDLTVFMYRGILKPNETASFIVIFDTFKVGNFTNVVVASSNETGNKTANNTTEVIFKINITKVWDDADNQDGIRPENVTVVLLADGEKVDEALLSKDNNWTAIFKELHGYDENGSLINYTIKELDVSNYTTVDIGRITALNITINNNRFEIRNNHTPRVTNITVNKVWNDTKNQDGLRPANVTVHLWADNVVINTTVLTAENNWTCNFTDLDVNKDGKPIVYKVTEDNVTGYTIAVDEVSDYVFNVTNTHIIYVTNVTVNKVWNDTDNQDGIRPANVTVHLFDGEGEINSTNLTAENNWTYTFTDLPVNKDGKPIVYYIKEDAVENYTSSVSDIANNTINVTNTHVPALINITVNKKWNDSENQDGIRPANVIIHLLAGDVEVNTTVLTAENNWTCNFTDLAVNKDGKSIVYTIKEDNVTGYVAQMSELVNNTINVTNTHVPELTNITVKKIWVDNGDYDKIRPGNVTVHLWADGVLNQSINLTAEGNWTANFTNLPVKKNGLPIVYTITEDNVTGYNSTVDNFTVTNTHIRPDMDVVKLTLNKTVYLGEETSFTIMVTNTGNCDLTDISVVEEVPAGLRYDGKFSGKNWYSNGLEFIYKGVLAPGDSIRFNITFVTVKSGNWTNVVNATSNETENKAANNNTTVIPAEVNVSKVWNDTENQDGLRPANVTVHLFADDIKVNSTNLTADNEWKYVFSDLPVYKDGKKIVYTVVEDKVDYYTVSVNETNGTFVITNTHIPYVTNVTVNKTWNDCNDQDGLRPANVTVHLFADGIEVRTAVLTADDNWTFTFTDLAVNNGTVIVYTVKEDVVGNYTNETVKVDNYTFEIINTHVPYVTNITINKKWNDTENQDGLRPANVTVHLFADNVEINSTVLSAENNWTYNFTNLHVNKEGKPISYTVVEDNVTGYTVTVDEVSDYVFNVTNTHVPELTNITVNKIWVDNGDYDKIRPANVTVHLWADGVLNQSINLTADGNWTANFTDLPVKKDGRPIVYTITEDNVTGYNSTVDNFTVTNTHIRPDMDVVKLTLNKTVYLGEETSFTIVVTNTGNCDLTDISVVEEVPAGLRYDGKFSGKNWYSNGLEFIYKGVLAPGDSIRFNITFVTVKSGNWTNVVNATSNETENKTANNNTTVVPVEVNVSKAWNDTENRDGLRPANVTVHLLADGVEVRTTVLSAGNDWKDVFADLPVYKDGKKIVYTVVEDNVNYYTVSVNETNGTFVITNTHVPYVTNVTVTKKWNDADNQDGLRPVNVTVHLLADGTEVRSAVLSADNNWTFTFTGLAVNEKGKVIAYSVKEDIVDNYINETSKVDNYTFVVINTHVPELINITVNKKWNDSDNQDGLRPSNVTVHLFADGVEIDSAVITAENNWTYKFTDLEANKDGKPINYSIKEDKVTGYTIVEIKEVSDNVFNVTNTHVPELTNITVNKVWIDNDNYDKVRPDNVTVRLLADGEVVAEVILSEKNNWTYNFTDLAVNNAGKPIKYAVEEENVPDYNTTVENFTVINTHVRPDMTVEKITLNKTVLLGEETSFTIKVTNTGNCDLTDISVVEDAPEGLRYDGKFNGKNWYNNGNEFIYKGILAPGESISFNITFTAVKQGDWLNKVNATSNETDNKTTNNTTSVLKPDMEVRKITLNESVYLGKQVGFTIVVINTGNANLTGVYVIDDDYTQGIVLDHMIPNDDWTFDGKNKFTYGKTLGVGQSANFTVIFNTTSVGDKINNVTADSNETPEVNSSNKTHVYVGNMTVQKISNNQNVKVGEMVSFTIIVKNTGGCDLTGVYVVDEDYSSGLVYDHFVDSSNKWKFDGNSRWDYDGVLGIGQEAQFDVVFKVTTAGFKVNNVTAGNNVTNETVNSTNTTNVTKETVPPKPVPPVTPTPQPPAPEVPDVPGKSVEPRMHATGNPFVLAVLALLAIGVIPKRRRK